jgi:NAD(P)H-dependent FMN reductase
MPALAPATMIGKGGSGSMLTLQVITASTRSTRQGPLVAEWFLERCRADGRFRVEPIDLADPALPLFDEPEHPKLRKYVHDHTKAWSATIERADAFVLVTPEYNFGMPPSLLNALDHLVWEWAYKPLGFVSYGGVSGGLRSVQTIKLTATALRMMPIPEAVSFQHFTQYIDKDSGAFAPPENQHPAATLMLDELLKWGTALKALREGK